MNVLFLIPRYHTNMISVVEALQEYGDQVLIITTHRGASEDYLLTEPLLLEKFQYSGLLAKIKLFNPDLVIVRSLHPDFLRISKKLRLMGVKTIHYDQTPLYIEKKIFSLPLDLLIKSSLFIKTLSTVSITPVWGGFKQKGYRRKFSKFFFWPSKIRIPFSDINSAFFPKIVMIGKLAQPRKRHLWLIRACQSLSLKFKISIIGSIDSERIYTNEGLDPKYFTNLLSSVNELRSNGVDVDLFQNIRHHETLEILKTSNIFVLPSTDEPFSISPLEAMSCGCAVLISDTNGFSYLIDNGKNGLLFKNNDFDDFKNKLSILVYDHGFRKEIQLGALDSIKRNHNYKDFVNFMHNL